MGWRVDNSSPISISTAYRWITAAVQAQYPGLGGGRLYALFPVTIRPAFVFSYNVVRNGPALSRESQETIVPGDYGIFTSDGSIPETQYQFTRIASYSSMGQYFKTNCVALATKASLTPTLIQQALDRDNECIFSGVVPNHGVDATMATWVFPPFLGYTLSSDQWLEYKYQDDPDACDLSEFMVAENVVSGLEDIIALFCDNKIGIDVDDNYHIVNFDGPEYFKGDVSLKMHLTLANGPHQPSDRFLRLHFERCLAVSAFGGGIESDYTGEEIDSFMEVLGVFDNQIDSTDPRWSTPLGIEVYAYLIRQRMAEKYIDEEEATG